MEESVKGNKDTCLNLVKEYDRVHFFKRFFLRIIKFAIFAYTFDPFAIYKGTFKRNDASRFQLYLSPQLRMKPNYIDRWRDRWTILARILIAYICMKFSIIVLVQVYISLYIKKRQQQQQHISTSPMSRGKDEVSHQQSMSPSSTKQQDAADLNNNVQSSLALFNQILGNPLTNLPGITIFLYSVIVASVISVLLYLPIYHQIEPMDWVNLRLWLEPVREFRRIDMIILETLNEYRKPFQRFCYCNFGKHSSNGPHYALIASRAIQTQVMSVFRRRYWCFRPINYTIDWYKRFNRFVLCLSVPMCSFLLTFTVYFARHSLNIISGKLKFSSFQVITFLETTCGLAMVVATIMLLIVIFLSNCLAHLLLLRDTKLHLLTCLDELKRMKDYETKEVDHLAVICVMLKPLISISLSLNELRINAKSLTEMVSVNLFISSIICVSILFAENIDGQDLYMFRVAVMIGLWFWANITLTGCAYIYKRSLKLEKITWSLMAEIRWRESTEDWLLFESQVAEFWRRLIFSKSFSDSRLSVRPFGATLTYDRALQLNFFAISIAGLLKTIYE